MNKRGEDVLGVPDTLLGAVFEILILFLVVWVVFGFLKALLFPSQDTTSIDNFNALAEKMNILVNNPTEFAARRDVVFNLKDQYTIVGFSKDKDTFETCGDAVGDPTGGLIDTSERIEKISKPAICGDKACLCLYMDDTKAGNADNLDFNEALQDGYQKVVACKQINADYIFSHPYSIFRGDSYRSLKGEWAATSNSFFNTGSAPSKADESYYLLAPEFNDYIRNFRGYLWEGPHAFDFKELGFEYTALEDGKVKEVSIPRGPNPDYVQVSQKEAASNLWYFENRLNLYKWCEAHQLTERDKCVEGLEKAGITKIGDKQERILSKVYSSFVLYGECQSNHPQFDDGEFKIGNLYLEKFRNPDTGSVSIFVGLSSPYTAERESVLEFFRGEETTGNDMVIYPEFEGLTFDMNKIKDYQINEAKKDQEFMIKNFDLRGNDLKIKLVAIDSNAPLESGKDPKLVSTEKISLQFSTIPKPLLLYKYDLSAERNPDKFSDEVNAGSSMIYEIIGIYGETGNNAGELRREAKFRLAFTILDENTVSIAILSTEKDKAKGGYSEPFINIPALSKEKQQLFTE